MKDDFGTLSSELYGELLDTFKNFVQKNEGKELRTNDLLSALARFFSDSLGSVIILNTQAGGKLRAEDIIPTLLDSVAQDLSKKLHIDIGPWSQRYN